MYLHSACVHLLYAIRVVRWHAVLHVSVSSAFSVKMISQPQQYGGINPGVDDWAVARYTHWQWLIVHRLSQVLLHNVGRERL